MRRWTFTNTFMFFKNLEEYYVPIKKNLLSPNLIIISFNFFIDGIQIKPIINLNFVIKVQQSMLHFVTEEFMFNLFLNFTIP
ncbi:hypothetical protein BpHYR1_048469 [Brachionus plicatilis]|uniref:Uncharacterized protein n=1 Tax=Brachionus plicatilis TaxID=10195 RepID=A0A3M7SIW4_BRAPC|nr:hypothetical protein BpHYR1_048469 [Brachionus plicatilis]